MIHHLLRTAMIVLAFTQHFIGRRFCLPIDDKSECSGLVITQDQYYGLGKCRAADEFGGDEEFAHGGTIIRVCIDGNEAAEDEQEVAESDHYPFDYRSDRPSGRK